MFQKANSEIVLIISMLAILSCLFALPTSSAQSELHQKALQSFQNFTSLSDQERMNAAARMSADEKAMIMMGATQMTQEVNETIAGMSPAELQKATIYLLRFGNFTSQQNGTQAEGLATVWYCFRDLKPKILVLTFTN